MSRPSIEAWFACNGCGYEPPEDKVPKICPECDVVDMRLNVSLNLPGVTSRDIIGVIADFFRYKEEFSDGD